MNRGCGCLSALALLGLLLLLQRWLGWSAVMVAAAAVVAIGLAVFMAGPHRRHPGKAIGVKSPRSGRRRLFWHKDHESITATVQRVERDDPVARRVVETVALLHADGVPRWVLRVPEDVMDEVEDQEDAEFIGFAGLEVDEVLDRLCAEGLLHARGDLVKIEPKVALAVRVRLGRLGRAHEAPAMVGKALYVHATGLRLRANAIAFHDADASGADAVAERARALLDQAVTLAWHTQYTYDKALDSILQLNACLAELGFLADALVLARQMSGLCARKLPPGHSVARDAVVNVEVLRKALRDGGLRPSTDS